MWSLGVARYTDVTVRYVPRFGSHDSIRFRYNRKKTTNLLCLVSFHLFWTESSTVVILNIILHIIYIYIYIESAVHIYIQGIHSWNIFDLLGGCVFKCATHGIRCSSAGGYQTALHYCGRPLLDWGWIACISCKASCTEPRCLYRDGSVRIHVSCHP